jgi:hypothetical protein
MISARDDAELSIFIILGHKFAGDGEKFARAVFISTAIAWADLWVVSRLDANEGRNPLRCRFNWAAIAAAVRARVGSDSLTLHDLRARYDPLE